MHPVLCNNAHHDVANLVNHRMVENTKFEILENGNKKNNNINKKIWASTSNETFLVVIVLYRR